VKLFQDSVTLPLPRKFPGVYNCVCDQELIILEKRESLNIHDADTLLTIDYDRFQFSRSKDNRDCDRLV